jgi:hypothetical protein
MESNETEGYKKNEGEAGLSCKKQVHVFIVGDLSHPCLDAIVRELNRLIGSINALGYVLQTKFVLQDLGSEQKEITQ